MSVIWECVSDKLSDDAPLVEYIIQFIKKRDDIVISSNVSNETFSFSENELLRHLNFISIILNVHNEKPFPIIEDMISNTDDGFASGFNTEIDNTKN